jgi:hypothetical protein
MLNSLHGNETTRTGIRESFEKALLNAETPFAGDDHVR